MKNINVKTFVWVILITSIIAWGVILLVSGLELKLNWKAFEKLPQVVSIEMFLWIGFVNWGWKWKVFHGWLVPFPIIQGTWHGTLKSTWTNPETNKVLEEIPMVLVIKQTFTTISCTIHTYTQESSSQSYAATILIDDESGSKQLVYSYTNRPKAGVRHRSAVHDGTALLQLIEKPQRMLEGEYWTNRKTTGDIKLLFRCKELLEKFPNDLIPTRQDNA